MQIPSDTQGTSKGVNHPNHPYGLATGFTVRILAYNMNSQQQQTAIDDSNY